MVLTLLEQRLAFLSVQSMPIGIQRGGLPAITLGEVRGARTSIMVSCPICHSRADMPPTVVRLPDHADMNTLG